MDLESIGRILLLVGVGIALLGGVLLLVSRFTSINQISEIPGTISITTGPVSCFFPILAMIALSVILTVVVNVILRLINRQ